MQQVVEDDRYPSSGVRVFKSFGALTLGKIVGDAVTFVLFILISRNFGPEGIGTYSFAVALTGMIAVLSELGTDTYTVREISRAPPQLPFTFGAILSLRLVLLLLAALIILAALLLLPFSSDVIIVVALIGGYQLSYGLLQGFGAVLIAVNRSTIAAVFDGACRAGGSLLAIVAAAFGANLIGTLVALPFVSVTSVPLGYLVLERTLGRPRLSFARSRLRRVWREVLPYGLGGIVGRLQQRLDVALLGLILGTAAAGLYNVAHRPAVVLWFVPHYVAISLLPVASNLYARSSGDLQRLYYRTLNLAVLVGMPASAGLALVAPDVIPLLFGHEFGDSVLLLRILSWLFLLAFARFVIGAFLTACGRQVQRTRAQAVVLVTAAALYLVLIPTLGVLGAAITAVVAEALLGVLFSLYLRPVLGWPSLGRSLLVSGPASAAFVLLFARFLDWPLPAVIAASVAIYVGALALIPQVRAGELRPLLEWGKSLVR